MISRGENTGFAHHTRTKSRTNKTAGSACGLSDVTYGLALDKFLDLSSLTNSVTQIVELASTNLTGTNDLYARYVGRMDGEYSFNANTEGYASYSEGLGNSAALLSDNCSFENLDSFLGAFLDLNGYANGITDVKSEGILSQLLLCKSINFVHGASSFIIRHSCRAEWQRTVLFIRLYV